MTDSESVREHIGNSLQLLLSIPSGVLANMGSEYRRCVVDAIERQQAALRLLDYEQRLTKETET